MLRRSLCFSKYGQHDSMRIIPLYIEVIFNTDDIIGSVLPGTTISICKQCP